jgi:glutamate-1-semialdehyde aminotransferase
MPTFTTRARALVAAGSFLLALTACSPEETDLAQQLIRSQQAANDVARSTNSLTDAQLARLAACESGGNPTIVSKSGKYHGLYQFDQRTWNSTVAPLMPAYVNVAPSKAPAEIQDAAARALYSARGRSPWPVCGRRI